MLPAQALHADKAAARLSHLSLHPHGSTDPAQDELQSSAHHYDKALAPHLVHILRQVGLGDRLLLCARVSRSWCKAAVEATDTIISTKPDLDVASLLSMCRWLHKHGRALNKLQLQVVLPRPESSTSTRRMSARSLRLEAQLEEERDQQFIRGLAAATNLTSLSVTCPGVFAYNVAELASLQSLLQLELVDAPLRLAKTKTPGMTFLQQIPSLTHLKVGGDFSFPSPSDRCLQSVWALTQLRSLEVEFTSRSMSRVHSVVFEGLSGMTQLSSISLRVPSLCVMSAGQEAGAYHPFSSMESLPGLGSLTQLKVLKLQQVKEPQRDRVAEPYFFTGVQPSLLSGFTNLEHLALEFAALAPSAAGAQDLLNVLPQLQQLTALQLHVGGPWSNPQTAFTALVASSRLRYLNFDGIGLSGSNIWSEVFASNNPRLQQLEEVSLLSNWLGNPGLKLEDIGCIVRSCPNLKAFSFDEATAEAMPLLTSLTKLHTTEVSDDVLCALAQELTGLRDLQLESECGCTPAGLLELTGLRQLTRLHLDHSVAFCGTADYWFDVLEFVQKGCLACCPPDVHEQWSAWWQENSADVYHKQAERYRQYASGGHH